MAAAVAGPGVYEVSASPRARLQSWENPEDGNEVQSWSVITTEANAYRLGRMRKRS